MTITGIAPDLPSVQQACAGCVCCSAALCRAGRASALECVGCTHEDYRATVAGCPCSATTTEGTAAWRAGMVTATLQATDLPLPEPMETLLRALAAREPAVVEDPHEFSLALRLRQFVQIRGERGELAVTSLGRAYLAARDGRRVPARASVAAIDTDVATATVWVDRIDEGRPDVPVTVLLDQLVSAAGVEPGGLPGLELDVVANLDAARRDDIVLTDIHVRPTAPLPEAWRTLLPAGPARERVPAASGALPGGGSGD